MSDFSNPDYIFQEAEARRKRALQNAGYQIDLKNLIASGNRQMMDIGQQYRAGMEPRVSGFAKRGLGNSGLFRNAMSQYATKQQQDINDLLANQQGQVSQLNLQEQSSGVSLQDELDRIKRAKANDILNSAMTLKDWQPYTGLYA